MSLLLDDDSLIGINDFDEDFAKNRKNKIFEKFENTKYSENFQ